jgi:RNA polymerase sigma factor (sigma-70 family)
MEVEALWARFHETRAIEDRNRLVEHYLNDSEAYAVRATKRKRLRLRREDATQVGRIALIRAVDSFVPDGRANFRTWLTSKIVFALLDECRAADHFRPKLRREGDTRRVRSFDTIREEHPDQDVAAPEPCNDPSCGMPWETGRVDVLDSFRRVRREWMLVHSER